METRFRHAAQEGNARQALLTVEMRANEAR
jgi:hypothetical protein